MSFFICLICATTYTFIFVCIVVYYAILKSNASVESADIMSLQMKSASVLLSIFRCKRGIGVYTRIIDTYNIHEFKE